MGLIGNGCGSSRCPRSRIQDLAAGLEEARWLAGLRRPRRLPVKPRSPGNGGSTPDTSATGEAEKGDAEDEVAVAGVLRLLTVGRAADDEVVPVGGSSGVTTHIPMGP